MNGPVRAAPWTRFHRITTATLAALLLFVAGFAVASIVVTHSSQNGSGNYVTASGTVAGLTYTSSVLAFTGSPAPAASTGSSATPQALVVGANVYCVSATCTAYDPAELVTYTFTAVLAGSVQVSLALILTSGPATVATTLYLKQAATAVAGTVVLVFDLGTGGAVISGLTLNAQQCAGASCP
jgi:hypothetical protein